MSTSAPPDPLAVRTLYSPHAPTPPQAAYYLLDELGVLEAIYGGAAGGGKSDALLTAALRYVDVPGYAALLLRRSYADLALPSAIMARSKEWLMGSDARWSKVDFRWTFPSGATLSFGYLRTYNDVYRYQSAEFQFIGFDELTQFTEAEYRYLFTRLRRPSSLDPDNPLAQVPLRIRSASNPGGRGHLWVKRRLIRREVDPDDEQDTLARARRRVFIPAKLADNPHVDRAAYEESLNNVDPFLRSQMLEGDWDAREPGDWVYDQHHLEAAFAYGLALDELLANGTMPPPAGELLSIGLDWGENTHAVIGWPLEQGGLYIAAEVALESTEPTASAEAIIAELERVVRLGQQARPAGWSPDLTTAQLAASARRPGPRHPPALPPKTDAVRLVSDHRYDAAGVQSMRTYMRTIRRRHATAKSKSIPFGAPAPVSGKSAGRRSYKAETIGYLRRLLERTYAADDVPGYVQSIARPDWDDRRKALEVKRVLTAGKLAVSPERCPILAQQLRDLEWADRDAGKVNKGNDHGADAVIADAAPLAIRHR